MELSLGGLQEAGMGLSMGVEVERETPGEGPVSSEQSRRSERRSQLILLRLIAGDVQPCTIQSLAYAAEALQEKLRANKAAESRVFRQNFMK